MKQLQGWANMQGNWASVTCSQRLKQYARNSPGHHHLDQQGQGNLCRYINGAVDKLRRSWHTGQHVREHLLLEMAGMLSIRG